MYKKDRSWLNIKIERIFTVKPVRRQLQVLNAIYWASIDMFSSSYSLLSSLKNLNILSDKDLGTSLSPKSNCLTCTKKQLGCAFTGEKSVSKESSLLALANNSLTAGRNSRAHKRTDGQQHKSSVLSTAYQEGPAHEDQPIEIDDENEAENTGKPQGGWGMTVFSALNPSVVTTGTSNYPFLSFCVSCLATNCLP